MKMRHMINGQSVDLRLLTDRELQGLVTNHQMRIALVNDELESLIGEQIRRQPIVVPSLLGEAPTLF